MISFPSGARGWLAAGQTDMRKGFDGLALLVQETLRLDPHSGHLFVFRGRRGGLLKVLWHDGQGMCLYANGLERGRGQAGAAEGQSMVGAAILSLAPRRERVGRVAWPALHGEDRCRGARCGVSPGAACSIHAGAYAFKVALLVGRGLSD